MPSFTYDQCDRIHRKIHNFDNIIGQFYLQNYSSVTGKLMKTNENAISRERLMRNYESGVGYDKMLKENVYMRKYGQINKVRNPLKERNIQTHVQNYRSLQPFYQKNSFSQQQQHSTIHPLNSSQQQPSRISQSTLLYQQGYQTNNTLPQTRSYQQKSSTINELNSRIKKIMTKYDYEFSGNEMRALVGNEQRITLPSFRKEIEFGGEVKGIRDVATRIDWKEKDKEKKSSGFIKVEESESEQDINLSGKDNQNHGNQFSPYSDEENFNKTKPNNNYCRQPAVKKQIPLTKNHHPPQNNIQPLQTNPFSKITINQPNSHRPQQIQQAQKQPHVTFMCKSQLIQDLKNKTQIINLNRGYNNHHDEMIESSQKKRQRYLKGYHHEWEDKSLSKTRKDSKQYDYLNLPKHKRTNRIMSGSLEQQRSQYLDRSIEQLNERILEFEQKKKRLNINFKPFNLQQFKHKLYSSNNNQFQMQLYPSFEIKKSTQENFIEVAKEDSNNQDNQQQLVVDDAHKLQQPKEQPNNREEQKEQFHDEVQKLQNVVKDNENEENFGQNTNKQPSNNQDTQCQMETLFSNVQLCANNNSSSRTNTSVVQSNSAHLSLISCTNSLTIPTNPTQISSPQQTCIQPLITTPATAPKSSQKRLNRSSLLIKKPQNTRNAFQLLLINLIKQIQLDQQLRNLKTWFQFCYQEENKWQELKKLLRKSLVKRRESLMVRREISEGNDKMKEELKIEEMMVELMQNDQMSIERVFAVNINQHDPFFNLSHFTKQSNPHSSQHKLNTFTSQQPFSIPLLLQKYESSQLHWLQHLHKKHSSQQLINSGFSSSSLDLERKSVVEIQDMVRLVNMNVGSGYRNRDLVMIWDRILASKEKEKLKGKIQNVRGDLPRSQKVQFKFLLMAFSKRQRV